MSLVFIECTFGGNSDDLLRTLFASYIQVSSRAIFSLLCWPTVQNAAAHITHIGW